MESSEPRPLDRRVVITALGIAQILAWGTSFYFPAVFAEPIVRDTGWSLGWVVGGTSIRGGLGGILGTVLAAMLLGSIRTALVFLKIGEMATFWERAIQGGFILAAVLADHFARAAEVRRSGMLGGATT